MAWLAVDKSGDEYIYDYEPVRASNFYWIMDCDKHGEFIGESVELPKGSVKKLIGRDLTWDDEPVEI